MKIQVSLNNSPIPVNEIPIMNILEPSFHQLLFKMREIINVKQKNLNTLANAYGYN